LVPTDKRDTMDMRANIVGSTTGGMLPASFVLKDFCRKHATIFVFCHAPVSGK
jgi:hypothetical protein